ncbi:pyrroline-5-carboxylate reductase dimerization domain-containing protein, partial [Streptomyces sp. SID9124]|uniref:pyrroline-5-carboxylate reductase family protein n=1 Tax=Streptomyces sp. SID9124 TaxID=2706108 RepID=UPI0013DFD92C
MIVIYGGGAMGESLLAGLVRGGRDTADLAVCDRSAERARTLAERYGARQVEAEEGARSAEAVLLVVPPKAVPGLLDRIAPVLRPDCLVLSLAAGQPTGEVERALRPGTAVVRVMPNTAVEVGQGMCVLSGGRHAGPDRIAEACRLLGPLGDVVEIPEEQQDAATALAGSGPAYFYYVIEHLAAAGAALGLAPDAARRMAVAAASGAGGMLR